MEFEIREHGKYLIFDLLESIDITNAADYRIFLQDLLDKDKDHVILNFKSTTVIDSAGIGVLITFEKKFKALNHEFALMNLNERLEEYFNIAGLLNFFTIYKNENDLL